MKSEKKNQGTKISVALADDNDMMRTLLRGILRSEDFDVVGECKDGEHAVDVAVRLSPNVILLDIMMPGMDGLEALQEIRRKAPNVKVIMITASASAGNVKEAIQNGASAFIVKPFSTTKVIGAITKVVGLS
jgi:two-component system chemotaxis response regulator CheY